MSSSHRTPTLSVIAFCAQWCGTCREFQPIVDALAACHPEARFTWLDIEDDAELVDDVDIENFPTLAIFRDGLPVYFGTTLPLEKVVAQLLRAAGDSNVPLSPVPDAVIELHARLTA